MDKLGCMRAFMAVVEAGGFSPAARRMGVSKAMISKQVGQLETELGVRLLHRTTRQVNATGTGQAYFEQCRPLLAELDELDAAIHSNTAEPRGELRVTAPISFAELHLMRALSEFSNRYPEVRLNLILSDRFVDLVDERIDVAVRIGELQDSSLVARKLGRTSLLACAAPAYLDQRGEPTHPLQLSAHSCVVDSNHPTGTLWTFREGNNEITVNVTAKVTVNSARAARELTLLGEGISYLPSFAIADDIAEGRLRRLLPDHESVPLGIYAMYPHRRHLSAKVRLFIDHLAEQCKEMYV
ncbi:MAG: LysR family transcriptional regulator [Gammaproteobacteria bacterium]|nr:LysR family transcriptional regulator [Gammaproteobacteria bacterium]HXK56459.1 LysR substrate-binding domain-containing protein [Gammaproteobacteria bacterium]